MAPNLLLVITLVSIIQFSASITWPTTSVPPKSGTFAGDLFSQIAKARSNENVILSPLSIQTALGMLYIGAEEETADEIVQALRLPNDKVKVATGFAEILNAKNGETDVKIANRIYVKSSYQLQANYNAITKKYFHSKAKAVDFDQSATITQINSWVEQNTNNKISNLLQPGSVGPETSALIVNAIYFLGKWQRPFSTRSTSKSPFWNTPTTSVDVEGMYLDGERFKYADLPDLDATALELPYKDSNISMLLILPTKRDGLSELEENLRTVDLNQVSSRLSNELVNVLLPKFHIEFTVGLSDELKNIGIRSIFEDTANLNGIIQSGPKLKVSNFQHKAFIDVNEAGSEAAAASFLQLIPLSLNYNQKDFFADHPFVFAIKSPKIVYFIGHVAKL